MPDPTPTQQGAIEASIGWYKRSQCDLPKDKREAGIEFVRRNYADVLKNSALMASKRAWLEVQIKGIRSLISEIDASGDTGGRA